VGADAHKRADAWCRRQHEAFLEEVPLLKELEPYERVKIADALETETFKDGDVILRQGCAANEKRAGPTVQPLTVMVVQGRWVQVLHSGRGRGAGDTD
jgi:hypothetical protein